MCRTLTAQTLGHEKRRVAFGSAVALQQLRIAHQTVAVLDEQIPVIGQLRFMASALARQPRIRIGAGLMRIVAPQLAVEVHRRVAGIVRLGACSVYMAKGNAGTLMRDPFLARGPDGAWHLLWTWGWTRKEGGGQLKIGHATSRDLVQWSAQQEILVMPDEPSARNAWAHEAVWDERAREWIVFWSTTIPGRFPDTEGTGDSGYNHRLYAMTTRDWVTFSPARLWFDPGFNAIDATLVKNGKSWIMVFKDERRTPVKKNLRLAFAESPAGPWRGITEPFTKSWVEGPSVVKIGAEWWIYFDHYAKPQHYEALRTRDWKTFEDMRSAVRFPQDHRHGTVVRISEKDAKRLQTLEPDAASIPAQVGGR